MAQNPPQTTNQSKTLFGIPVWMLAVAGAAFLIGVFIIFRQRGSTSSSGGVTGGQLGYGVPTPVPFSTASTPNTTPSQQAAGTIILKGDQNTDSRGVPVWSYDINHQGIIGFEPVEQPIPYTKRAVGFMGDPGWIVQYGPDQGFIQGQYVISATPPASAKAGATNTSAPSTPASAVPIAPSQFPPMSLGSGINATSMPAAVGG